jgi:hypothetical protein
VVEKEPWLEAQEALFRIIRVWVADFPEPDQEKVTGECLKIMEGVNEVKGASFIFVCELARMVVTMLVKYLCVCTDTFPTLEEMLAEVDVLELEFIEEFTVAEFEGTCE